MKNISSMMTREIQFMNISDDELLKNPPYQLAYKIDKLISPSEDSRQAMKFKNNPYSSNAPRPQNEYFLFRKNFSALLKLKGINMKNGEKSRAAAAELRKQPPIVRRFFKILAELAKDEHNKFYPNYTFKRNKNKSKTRRNKTEIIQFQLRENHNADPNYTFSPKSHDEMMTPEKTSVNQSPESHNNVYPYYVFSPESHDEVMAPENTSVNQSPESYNNVYPNYTFSHESHNEMIAPEITFVNKSPESYNDVYPSYTFLSESHNEVITPEITIVIQSPESYNDVYPDYTFSPESHDEVMTPGKTSVNQLLDSHNYEYLNYTFSPESHDEVMTPEKTSVNIYCVDNYSEYFNAQEISYNMNFPFTDFCLCTEYSNYDDHELKNNSFFPQITPDQTQIFDQEVFNVSNYIYYNN
ncbi:MATA-HMG [Gigaspora margarita]|uniref:MATA-HMG n=1 Tax=Gigaspora margarita TaxID=4874 RepID=A0A8H4AY26_GIGMA|nr:MATA-HMG [Gigaspora margarita]